MLGMCRHFGIDSSINSFLLRFPTVLVCNNVDILKTHHPVRTLYLSPSPLLSFSQEPHTDKTTLYSEHPNRIFSPLLPQIPNSTLFCCIFSFKFIGNSDNPFKNHRDSPMPFFQDLMALLGFTHSREKTQLLSASFVQNLSNSLSNVNCTTEAEADGCREESTAFVLKMIGIGAILVAGVFGVAIPLVGKKRRFLQTDSNFFVVAKAFAAGVILATGFVHMLPDATESLNDPCLPKIPWSKFPFSGFIAMMAALATLLAEFLGTQYYERKQEKHKQTLRIASVDSVSSSELGNALLESHGSVDKVFGEEEGGAMHIVGMHAHAAHHGHSHNQGHGACQGHRNEHSHSHGFTNEDAIGSVRHIVVSQILELGIVSHSVIIGLSLGVSQSPCTIRPLIAALSFHQFFEGFALGGCISQAQLRSLQSILMACFFAITTPLGIAVGSGISNFYNPNSPRALAIEGILDSISAGILVYMALVDLIAADFLSKRMSCNVKLQVISYIALFLGASLMSGLALWA